MRRHGSQATFGCLQRAPLSILYILYCTVVFVTTDDSLEADLSIPVYHEDPGQHNRVVVIFLLKWMMMFEFLQADLLLRQHGFLKSRGTAEPKKM